jgi:polyphosphate kinase
VKGISDNIRVRSIIGRFLEHHRVFYFYNGGAEDVYLASADWMDRNVFRRIETCFPVLDDRLKRRVMKEGLRPYLHDNAQAWTMDANGNYGKPPSRRARSVAQESLLLDLGATA